MLPVLERRDAVIDEFCGTAPHHDSPLSRRRRRTGSERRLPPHTAGKPSEAEVNRWPDIILVTVLVKTEPMRPVSRSTGCIGSQCGRRPTQLDRDRIGHRFDDETLECEISLIESAPRFTLCPLRC